jgi:hypothetical protein
MTLIRIGIHVKLCLIFIPLILAVLEECVSPMRLGIVECLRAPVLANVSHESGLVLQDADPRATKTERSLPGSFRCSGRTKRAARCVPKNLIGNIAGLLEHVESFKSEVIWEIGTCHDIK